MANFKMNDMKGVISAMISVFDENENVDLQKTRDLVDFQIKNGVEGFYVTGSTGEGFLMTQAERNAIVDVVVNQVAGRVPVIVHVGDMGTKKSIDLAKHAYEAGADALSSVPPFYWRFSEENIFNYYKDISESTPLPMVVYNVPLAGLMGTDLLVRLSKLPNVGGLKFTGSDHAQMGHMIEATDDDFIIFSGMDEMAMSGTAVGADGIIGSFYNAIPETFAGIFYAVKEGDMKKALRLQTIATEIILEAVKYDYFSVIRHMIGWQGVDAGYSRRPFRNYTSEEMEPLKAKFAELKVKYNITDEEVHFMAAI